MDKEETVIQGIIIRGVGGLYGVRLTHNEQATEAPRGEVLCRARGIFRLDGITPMVGDRVEITREDVSSCEEGSSCEDVTSCEEASCQERISAETAEKRETGARVDYVIDRILPRSNALIRPPTANLTHLFAVIPAAQPKPDLLTADKLTAIAENYGVEPVVVVNKADVDPENAAVLTTTYEKAGYSAFALSAATGEGTERLYRYIERKAAEGVPMLSAFAGVSGAGKSTLMTRLFPELALKTGRISRKTERGRHTTRHVELYPVQVGAGEIYIADTPGFSMLDFTRFNFFPTDELAFSFREFADCAGACRYTKCTHVREEGCAVLERVRAGVVAESRHESYVKILEEMKKKPEWARQKEEKNANRSVASQTTQRQGKKHGKK